MAENVGKAPALPYLTLQITDAFTFALNIGGETPNFDYALNMLAQATRYIEQQQRIAQMVDLQKQQRDAAAVAAVRHNLNRRS